MHENIPTGAQSCGHDPQTEMSWFDKLPKVIQRALRDAKFDFCAHDIMADVRKFNSPKTIARIREREQLAGML